MYEYRSVTGDCAVRVASGGLCGHHVEVVVIVAGDGQVPHPPVADLGCGAADHERAHGGGLGRVGQRVEAQLQDVHHDQGDRGQGQRRGRGFTRAVDACLLTGARPGGHPDAVQAWAGLEDASRTTTARVSYLAVAGPATEAGAVPYVGSLLVRGCNVVVASGAALAETGQFGSVRFVVAGAAAGSPPNVTTLPFTTSGLRAAVASAVTAGVHSAGGSAREGRETRKDRVFAPRRPGESNFESRSAPFTTRRR